MCHVLPDQREISSKVRTYSIATALLLCLIGVACVANEERPLEISRLPLAPVPYTFNSGVTTADAFVVRDAEHWRDAWNRLHSIRRPTPALPDIDFERQMVIVVAQGRKSSGGYAVEIAGATLMAGNLNVDIELTQPGSRCVVSTGFTAPVDIAVLPYFDGDVVFRESVTIEECQ